MSVIEKMSITGIRSFCPDDESKQLIEFFKPLTLILGPNGSGKTTIIECLRYMTTGHTPPNSDRSRSFVHDPRIAGKTEVKGKVQLQLKDISGKRVETTRNVVATQEQKKIHFQTIQGTITRYSANGEEETVNLKCAEIDKEMVAILGVSKAILNSVIFCHQEESNWPLSEGKALKQKFDEIFGATRYIKALEDIRKIRNRKLDDIKEYSKEAVSLNESRRKAVEFAENLEKTQTQLAAYKNSATDIEEKLKPITDKLQDIGNKELKIGRLQADLESNNALMGKWEKDKTDMQNVIKNIFDGTKEELQREMKNFSTGVTEKKQQLEEMKRKCVDLEMKQKNLQKKRSKMQEEFGKLKAEQKSHQDRIASRDSRLARLSQQLGLEEDLRKTIELKETLRESQIQNVLKNWKQKLAKTEKELEDTKAKFEETGNLLQQEIDKVRHKKSQKEQKQKTCIEKIARNEEVLQNINTELSQVDSLSNRQDDIKKDLTEAEEELETLEKHIDVNALRKTISEHQRHRKELELKLNELNQEMSQLQTESKVRTEMDLILKDKAVKQDAIDKVLQRHKETVIHLVGDMPERNTQDSIKTLLMNLNKEIQDLSKKLEKKRSLLSSLQTSKSFHMQELSKKEELLISHKNKIFDVCGSMDFDRGLDIQEKNIKELQDEKGWLAGSLYLFNQYIEKLSWEPCCPLCKRNFSREEEVQMLKQELQNNIQLMPNRLNEKEELIAQHQKRLNRMLELRPLKLEIIDISEKEIPELRSKIDEVADAQSKVASEISNMEKMLERKQCDSKAATDMLPDLAMLDNSQRELVHLKRRISTLSCQIGSGDIARTVQQVGEEQSSFKVEIDSMENVIESNRSLINEYNEKVQKLREKINDLRIEQVEIAGRLQKKNTLEDQRTTLAAENRESTNVVEEIKSELVTLEKKIQELVSAKKGVQRNNERELEIIRNEIAKEKKEMEYVDVLIRNIDRYVDAGKETQLIDHENKISNINLSIQNNGMELSELDKRKEELIGVITSQQIKYREYEDNIKLIDIQAEIKSLKSKCQKLQKKIGDFDVQTFLSEKQLLMDQEKQLIKERSELEGRQSELVKNVSDLEAQLQDEIYKDAEKKHYDMQMQLRTTEKVSEDLNKFYIALDCAVIRYHQMKMDEINKIVRDLWFKIYTSNDIDYIKICSSEDETESGLEKARRVYNYKVIMMKDEKEIDMRSHCSAGQKALASLIIRLALAETFCLNCGVLVLDEPTTNLDRDNINSLVEALVEIVKSKSEQSNFQLIIITHDEEFIELLGRSDIVDYFYKVSKNASACSRLNKCCISDLA